MSCGYRSFIVFRVYISHFYVKKFLEILQQMTHFDVRQCRHVVGRYRVIVKK